MAKILDAATFHIHIDEVLNTPHHVPSRMLYRGVRADKSYHLLMKSIMGRSDRSCNVHYITSMDQKGKPVLGGPFEVDLRWELGRGGFQNPRLLIEDARSVKPVGIIAGKYSHQVYTFSENTKGQRASTRANRKYQGLDMYEFAECEHKCDKEGRRIMTTFGGDKYVMESFVSHCEMQVSRNGKVCMYMTRHFIGDIQTGSYWWELQISPGIDPVLMLIFKQIHDRIDNASTNLPIPAEEILRIPRHMPTQPIYQGVSNDKFHHLLMKRIMDNSKKPNNVHYIKTIDEKGKPVLGDPFEVDLKWDAGRGTFQSPRIVIQSIKVGIPVAIIGSQLRQVYTFSPRGQGHQQQQQPPRQQRTSGDKGKQYQGSDLFHFAQCERKLEGIRKTIMETVEGDQYVMEPVGETYRRKEMQVTRNGKVCMYMKEHYIGTWLGSNHWEMKISPGIDPVLMVIFNRINDIIEAAEQSTD